LPHAGGVPNGTRYTAKVLIPCVTGIRQAAAEVNGDVTVIFGSMAPTDWTGGENQATFLHEAYAAGATGWFDAVGWHPYTGADAPAVARQFTTDPDQLVSIMSAHGDGGKKLWATEFGQTTGGDGSISEADQAALVTTAIPLWSAKPWAGPLIWYSLRDSGTSLTDREQHFGLLRNDGSPKPSYYALQSLLAP
jgi:hypothetical protein